MAVDVGVPIVEFIDATEQEGIAMTAQPTIPGTLDHSAHRSRRAVLAAGIGGVAATVAAAIGRPEVALAGSDGDVGLGVTNITALTTTIENLTTGGTVLYVASSHDGIGLYSTSLSGRAVAGESTDGYGVYGQSSSTDGVHGKSWSAAGVYGISNSGYGVYGTSTSQVGVYGDSANHPGVVGHSDNSIGVSGSSPNGTGVYGSSGIGVGVSAYSNATNRAAGQGWSAGASTGLLGYSGDTVPAAPANTGVFGDAEQDTTAKGVWGKSTVGRGVYGEATTGQGVRGYATTGVAVYGATSGLHNGYALRTVGRVRFDNSIGLASIAAATKSVTVSPGIDLTPTSAVVATLQGNPGGTTTVQRVAIDTTTDKFTIYLTANATALVKVAWHVFG